MQKLANFTRHKSKTLPWCTLLSGKVLIQQYSKNETGHEKTGILPLRKHWRRSVVQ